VRVSPRVVVAEQLFHLHENPLLCVILVASRFDNPPHRRGRSVWAKAMFPLLWASLAVADVTRAARNARSPLSNLRDDLGDSVSVSVEGKPVSQRRLSWLYLCYGCVMNGFYSMRNKRRKGQK